MEFSFTGDCSIEESTNPTLDSILYECGVEIVAEVEITCEIHERGADLTGLEVQHLDFHPDGDALKIKTLMDETLREAIRQELERKVRSEWREYSDRAFEHLQELHDYAQDRKMDEDREYNMSRD